MQHQKLTSAQSAASCHESVAASTPTQNGPFQPVCPSTGGNEVCYSCKPHHGVTVWRPGNGDPGRLVGEADHQLTRPLIPSPCLTEVQSFCHPLCACTTPSALPGADGSTLPCSAGKAHKCMSGSGLAQFESNPVPAKTHAHLPHDNSLDTAWATPLQGPIVTDAVCCPDACLQGWSRPCLQAGSPPDPATAGIGPDLRSILWPPVAHRLLVSGPCSRRLL